MLDSARARAAAYAPGAPDPKAAQLLAYQTMPLDELIALRPVLVEISEFDLPGFPRREVVCEFCSEKVLDGRDVLRDGRVACRSCAGGSYYEPMAGDLIVGEDG